MIDNPLSCFPGNGSLAPFKCEPCRVIAFSTEEICRAVVNFQTKWDIKVMKLLLSKERCELSTVKWHDWQYSCIKLFHQELLWQIFILNPVDVLIALIFGLITSEYLLKVKFLYLTAFASCKMTSTQWWHCFNMSRKKAVHCCWVPGSRHCSENFQGAHFFFCMAVFTAGLKR